jgi:hypothetical protein
MRNRQLIALLALTLSATAETPPSAAPCVAQAPAPVPAPVSGTTVPPQPPEVSRDVSRIPDIAIPSPALESNPAWKWEHDDQTKGSSNGTSNYPIYPDGHNGLPGRQFVTWYSGNGGHRYHLTFGWDAKATHFVYEANVYLVNPAEIANVEMDMNQVMSDGRTVIFGVQCSAHSKSWEYTYVDSSGTHWHPSNIRCNPHNWGTKQWHKVQIASHRDDDGNVTYDWIGFDGVYTSFEGATAFSAQSLRWKRGELLLNFQIDGAHNSGIMDAYLNNLAIYRW